MSLDAAHRGYDYQDLLTAIRFVDLLLGHQEVTHVDEKLFDGDVLDDLTTIDLYGTRERIQFKHTDSPPNLSLRTFTSQARDLKLDTVLTSVRMDNELAPRSSRRCRVVLRDGQPDAEFRPFLRLADPDPGAFAPGFRSTRFQLNVETCWPAGATIAGSRQADPFAFLRTSGVFQRSDVDELCSQLVIEVNAPEASFDLTHPGPAERILLTRLRDEIGAGSYPNHHRTAEDVAQALLGMARAAREKRCAPTRDEALRRTRLLTDYGAVPRAHPVDAWREVDRSSAVATILASAHAAAEASHSLVIVGPPGQGKSWICHQVLAAMQAAGWLVAEHYCFLNDENEHEPRVLFERIIGSLVARIAESDPATVAAQRPRFAADVIALVNALQHAREGSPERRIALVVDGLDHITRVLGRTDGREEPSRGVARRLASIELPPGCVWIVLSQPGAHLEPFEAIAAKTFQVPPLGRVELLALATRLGLLETLATPDPTSAAALGVLDALETLSCGNALYATYVCREIALRPLAATDPTTITQHLPAFDGTLHNYYTHLVSALGDGEVADTLALIDFGLTPDDLRQLWPHSTQRVENEITKLRPALIERANQGLRIYHESFARFLRDRLATEPTAIEALRTRIAEWLEARGFYRDIRAFRFLLPILEHLGKDTEVVGRLDATYLCQSVEEAFPPVAIIANIGVALRCAGRLQDWSAIVRLVELSRAVEAFEYERLGDHLVEFADVAVALLGGVRLSEQLLYDERTTVPSRSGIELCAALDRHGFPVPWNEYLTRFQRDSETSNTAYSEDSDTRVRDAALRGWMRVRFSTPDVVPEDYDWNRLVRALDDNYTAARAVDAMLDIIGPDRTLSVIQKVENNARYGLALAEHPIWNTDPQNRSQALTLALARPIPGTMRRLLALGVPTAEMGFDAETIASRLRAAAEKVTGSRVDPAAVDAWLDTCAMAARLAPSVLESEQQRVRGRGWYRCWLQFVAAVSAAEVALDSSTKAIAALQILGEQLEPFVGEPRACDLYSIRHQIKASISVALGLLRDEHWGVAVEGLQRVTYKLRVSANGESWGPIDPAELLATFIELCTPARRNVVEAAITFSHERTGNAFYSSVADLQLLRARCALRCGDLDAARASWCAACELFLAYGWRRDRTVFELLAPISSLSRLDQQRSRMCLVSVGPSCRRVLGHTDGKDTRYVLAEWFALAAEIDAEATSLIVARDLLGHCNDVVATAEKTRRALWKAYFRSVDPIVAGALRLSLTAGFLSDDQEALALLTSRACDDKATGAQVVLRHAAARLDERPTYYGDSDGENKLREDDRVIAQINAGLSAAGFEEICSRENNAPRSEPTAPPNRDTPPTRKEVIDALIVNNYGMDARSVSGLVQAFGGIRSFGRGVDHGAVVRLVNALGYRLASMAAAGQRPEVEILLHALADHEWFHPEAGYLSAIADGLERVQEPRLAAIANVLSWTRGRGGGGWLTFAGEDYLHLLERALHLDRQAAIAELFVEVERVVLGGYGSLGVTRALIEAAARLPLGADPSLAFAMWNAAAEVVAFRTPRLTADDDPSAILAPSGPDTPLKIERALCLATLAGLGHPSREQKRRTLLACSFLLQARPDIADEPFGAALEMISDPSTLGWLLYVLRENAGTVARSPLILDALERLCGSDYLNVRTRARQLLAEVDRPRASRIPLPQAAPLPALVTTVECTREPWIAYVLGDRLAPWESDLPGLASCTEEAVMVATTEIEARMQKQRRALCPLDEEPPDAFVAPIEAVETELQRVAGRARVSLAPDRAAIETPVEWEAALTVNVESVAEDALMVERTRRPRPPIPFPPTTFAPQLVAPRDARTAAIVALGDYRGFRVLASLEFRRPGSRSGTKASGSLCTGIELGCPPDIETDLPVALSDTHGWFEVDTIATPGEGPLVGYSNMANSGLNWLVPILTPQPWVAALLGLRPRMSDFILDDASGPALALCTWRAGYEVDDYRCRPLLVGAQLVLRSDCFESLLERVGKELSLREHLTFDDG